MTTSCYPGYISSALPPQEVADILYRCGDGASPATLCEMNLTITGSIGVIMSSWNYRRLMDKVGVRPQAYKSGRFKDMLSGTKDPDNITPEEDKMLQALIDETFAKFKRVVREGRELAFEKNSQNPTDKGRAFHERWEEYADGRVLSGTEAFRLGFVDQLGDIKAAVARTKSLAATTEANLIEYRQRYDFADLFRLFGRSETKSVKIDLGMELPRGRQRIGMWHVIAL